ncbi:MAG: tetratricopeptide repeat protein [Magnetococcales bacterium]|nr:tetratricopeptide repeat protein [Magnetococcales bacterium]
MARQKGREVVNPGSEEMARIIEEIRKLEGLVKTGAIDEAIRVGEAVLARLPGNVDMMIVLADIYWQKSAFTEAEELVAQALKLAPDNSRLHLRMGDIARFREQIDTAMQHYREAARLDPGNLDGHFQYGILLAQRERFTDAIAALQRVLTIKPDMFEAHLLLASIFSRESRPILANVHARLHDHYNETGPRQHSKDRVQDTYFLDGRQALVVARQGLQVQLGKGITGEQICYHHGPIEEAGEAGLPTLVHLPMNRIPAFFFDHSLRPPTTVAFDPADPQQASMALAVAKVVDRSIVLRASAIQTTVAMNIHRAPLRESGRNGRVFLFVSRNNTAGRIETGHMADAMQRLGCDVHLETEKNGMEMLDTYHILKAHYACNPHMTINFNHANNAHLHPDVFNVIWYQEAAREIQGGKTPVWRERDRILSASPDIDVLLNKCGVQEIHRQERCFDLTCFKNTTPLARRHKVVFVGDSHHRYLHFLPQDKVNVVVDVLGELFERGVVIPDGLMQELATQVGLPFPAVREFIHPYVVRNHTVAWLCDLVEELHGELDIHGRFWDELPGVAPLFRGGLAGAAEVAAVYNQARYALAPHPRHIHTRRLAEMAACGCLPLVYDNRLTATPSPWEDAILTFRTRDELRACLRREPSGEAAKIADTFSYDAMARRILDWVELRANL